MNPASSPLPHPRITDQQLTDLLQPRVGALIHIARQLIAHPHTHQPNLPNRPTLAVLESQASQTEELLDAYGAKNNARWHGFRRLIATLKIFARTHYILLHIELALPGYHLTRKLAPFQTDTNSTRNCIQSILQSASRQLLPLATELGLAADPLRLPAEQLPPGLLPQDRQLQPLQDPGNTVTRISSSFLNLAGEARALFITTPNPENPTSPANLPEEGLLRHFQEQFHNLQALYDTHLANTTASAQDPRLPSLRGHISIVFHLLDLATELAHFVERHLQNHTTNPIPNADPILQLLHHYSLHYIRIYLGAGRQIAQQLLRNYSKPSTIRVHVPTCRGFHVRPSTLIAKIVHHYQSNVSMTLQDETYDASSPLELFRANERINAQKRQQLADAVSKACNTTPPDPSPDLITWMRRILLLLAEQGHIILFEQPVPALEPHPASHPGDINPVLDEIARLQALGKIDVPTKIEVTFSGDQRVLDDIQCLAKHGYGEDAFGNNLTLPSQLRYLSATPPAPTG